MTEMTISQIQDRLFQMGCTICELLEQYKIPYMITYGTLLGAVRHKDFVPWDDDFDLHLFDDTAPQAIELLRNNLPPENLLEDRSSEPLYFHAWPHVKDLRSAAVSSLYPDDGKYTHKGLFVDLYILKKMRLSDIAGYCRRENEAYFKRKLELGFLSPSEYEEKCNVLKAKTPQLLPVPSPETSSSAEVYSLFMDHTYADPQDILPLRKYLFRGREFWGPNHYDPLLSTMYGSYMELPPVEKRIPHYSSVSCL